MPCGSRARSSACSRHHPLWMSLPSPTRPSSRLGDRGDGAAPMPAFPRQPDRVAQGHQRRGRDAEGLFHGLLTRRVRPYYLYQCDPISGSAHFRTSVDKGLEPHPRLARPHHGLRRAELRGRCAGRRRQDPAPSRLCRGTRGRRPPAQELRGKLYRYTDPEGTVGLDRNPRAG